MTASTKTYRYQLPRKAIKTDCPSCRPRYRKTLSRYVDTQTGEPIPMPYGRCDRESNCGYQLSPYQKGASGQSYTDEVVAHNSLPSIPKAWFSLAGKWKRKGVTRQNIISTLQEASTGASLQEAEQVAAYIFDKSATPLAPSTDYYLPAEVVTPSLGHYAQNQFAKLLSDRFGSDLATELLQRFQIGTSTYWPGSCVFWLIDEQGRYRAGQVVLFADDWHKARYTDKEGITKTCISSASHGLLRRYRKQNQPEPEWLTEYHKNAPRWPILFGLHQLSTSPIDKPLAIVEAPKTAVVCSALIPAFTWLAVGALSYLNAERLAPIRGRAVMLFPDLSRDGQAFTRWNSTAKDLNKNGHQITVSRLLEDRATEEQKQAGLDLADFLLRPAIEPLVVKTSAEWAANPGSILRPDESQLERLTNPIHYDFPAAPLAFNAERQLQWVLWCVLPPGVEEGSSADCAANPAR